MLSSLLLTSTFFLCFQQVNPGCAKCSYDYTIITLHAFSSLRLNSSNLQLRDCVGYHFNTDSELISFSLFVVDVQ